MPRYIDADALRADWLENGENEYVYDTNAFLDSIDNAPTADVVDVVRCKDCKRYETCELGRLWLGADGFCSDGERRNDG